MQRQVKPNGAIKINGTLYKNPDLVPYVGQRVLVSESYLRTEEYYLETINGTPICHLSVNDRPDEVGKYARGFEEMRDLFLDLWNEYPDTLEDATKLLRARFNDKAHDNTP